MDPKFRNKSAAGHVAAGFTILVWGTTFIATKVLLETFSPIEILLLRFALGYLGLHAICLLPAFRTEKRTLVLKDELVFAGAGLTGIAAYYVCENIALAYSSASNVGIIVSIAPLTTALVSIPLLKQERIDKRIALGFLMASIGVFFVMTNGIFMLELSPIGDFLALAATVGWAFYSILLKRIDTDIYPVAVYTRKIFFYGLLCMIPVSLPMGFELHASDFTVKTISLLIFLGLGAGTICFLTWNFSVEKLGVLRANAYIYLTPFITFAASAIILKERITLIAIIGSLCILGGLWLSEHRMPNKKLRVLPTVNGDSI